jgi:nitroreductase
MTVFDVLLSRQSVPARLLAEPAPSDEVLTRVFAAAVTAPDHGAIRPWRFLVIRGEARERLGDLFAAALGRREPEADEAALAEMRGKALRAPLVVVVCAKITPDHPKVPPIEQVLAAGAAAQNMLIALHALGYGAILVTGANAYDPLVKAGLGLSEDDAIVGFINIGSAPEALRPKRRPDPQAFVSSWPEAPTAADQDD